MCRLVPFFGDRELASITSFDVQQLQAQLAAGSESRKPLSAKTVNNHLGVLSRCLRSAVEHRRIEVNPVAGVDPLTVDPQRFRYYTAEETKVFLAAAQSERPPFPLLFEFLFRMGMRLGEARALRWEAVHLDRGMVHVVRSVASGTRVETAPKNGKDRWVPIPPGLAAKLGEAKRRRDLLVFEDPSGGWLQEWPVRAAWARTVRLADLHHTSPHDARHSYASQLVARGVPIYDVSKLLGHSTIDQTQRYAHLAPSDLAVHVVGLEE